MGSGNVSCFGFYVMESTSFKSPVKIGRIFLNFLNVRCVAYIFFFVLCSALPVVAQNNGNDAAQTRNGRANSQIQAARGYTQDGRPNERTSNPKATRRSQVYQGQDKRYYLRTDSDISIPNFSGGKAAVFYKAPQKFYRDQRNQRTAWDTSSDAEEAWLETQIEEIYKKQEWAQKLDTAHGKLLMSKPSSEVVKEAILKFPLEKVKFTVAQWLVEQHLLNMDSSQTGDPRRMSALKENVMDPVSMMGFQFFMLANGYTNHALDVYGYAKLDAKNRAILFLSKPYLGTSAGILASEIFHDASETFKACVISRLSVAGALTLTARKKAQENVAKSCAEAWRAWHGETISKRYLASIVGLLATTWLSPRIPSAAMKILKGVTPAVVFDGIEVAVKTSSGRLIVSAITPILRFMPLPLFLLIDTYVTPYLSRAYGIFSDSAFVKYDEARGVDLGSKTKDCLETVNGPRRMSRLQCFENLNEDILDWRDRHNSWRLNINSEYEGAKQGYASLIQKTSNQYSTATSYYMTLLETQVNDALNLTDLFAGIIGPEYANTVQDHFNRLYPLFGVFVPSPKFNKQPGGSREEIASEIGKLYLEDVSQLEKAQKLQVETMFRILNTGVDSLNTDEQLAFLKENFPLYEPLISGQLSAKARAWLGAKGLASQMERLSDPEAFQWIKENVLQKKDEEARASEFFTDVVSGTLFGSSRFWHKGLGEPILKSPGYILADERKAVDDLVAGTLSNLKKEDILTYAHGLLKLNAFINRKDPTTSKTMAGSKTPIRIDPELFYFVSSVRYILGNPAPILVPGMAFPYLYTANPSNAESMNPMKFKFPPGKYLYHFSSVTDYLNHEMLCGEPTARFDWEFGADATFHPPRLTSQNPTLPTFCKPNNLTPEFMDYQQQYTKTLPLFSGQPRLGVMPNIINNMVGPLSQIDTSRIYETNDESIQNAQKKYLKDKLGHWWETSATDQFLHFMAKMDKNYLKIHNMLVENLLRDPISPKIIPWNAWGDKLNFIKDRPRVLGAPFEALIDLAVFGSGIGASIAKDNWAHFLNPILERARVGEILPYNVGADLAVEMDGYIQVLKAVNSNNQLDAAILNLKSVFNDSLSAILAQTRLDFRSMGLSHKKELNQLLLKASLNFGYAIDVTEKILLDMKLPITEPLVAGFHNVNQNLTGYLESAMLAVYDPKVAAMRVQHELLKMTEQAQRNNLINATKGHNF